MINLSKIIPKRIKQAREAAGLTQGELADYLGVTRALVTSLEAGRSNLTIQHLEILPKILHRPISFFLGLTIEGLTPDEEELLMFYRSIPSAGPFRRFALSLVAQVASAATSDDEESDEDSAGDTTA